MDLTIKLDDATLIEVSYTEGPRSGIRITQILNEQKEQMHFDGFSDNQQQDIIIACYRDQSERARRLVSPLEKEASPEPALPQDHSIEPSPPSLDH